ncbi:MAG: hypothetical protein COT73_02170, partial [Bdellovibrio sp. CG10_big_fil_rev_8_21_14_0_10_47_8]
CFAAPTPSEENSIKIDALTDSCLASSKRDEICEALIQFREIGSDSLEAIKAYIHLTPRDYALLTMANAIATGRVRIRTKSYLVEGATDTFDIQKNSTSYTFEIGF